VVIHWLGEMFDPALEGYWGTKDHTAAMDICLDVLKKNRAKVDGIKISLLDKDKEIAMRRKLPKGVRMYTGDDGHQGHFVMVGGQQSARHLQHFCELFRLADAAGLLSDRPLACARMKQLLAVHGCG
jgi:hypothetical protein